MTELPTERVSAAPLFSVVVPVYNGACSLAQTLDSVLQQTWEAYEIIVVNDGSTDATGAIVDDYAQRYPDRVEAYHQANAGVAMARNVGIAAARGTWVAFLDADDVFLPRALELRARAVALISEDTSLLFTDYFTERFAGYVRRMASAGAFQRLLLAVTESEVDGVHQLSSEFDKKLLDLPSCIGTAAVTLRRSVFDEVGDFDTTKQVSEDVDMWHRSQRRHRAAFLDAPTGVYAQYRGAPIKYEGIHRERAAQAETILEQGGHSRRERRALRRRVANAYMSIAYKTRIPQGDLPGARELLRRAIWWSPTMVESWRQLLVASLPPRLRRILLETRYRRTRIACPGLPQDFYKP
ncbi:MAG: glycosyltransferase [Mariniblastus sp.]|nr:glycosyltransferase [Mariniblastus sp.]